MNKSFRGFLTVLRSSGALKGVQIVKPKVPSSQGTLGQRFFSDLSKVCTRRPLLWALNGKNYLDGGRRQVQTKGDKELTDFLEEEIKAEMKARKSPTPPQVNGFEITSNGSEVTLTKKFNNETVKVLLNVNHSVDAEEAEEPKNQDKETEMGEMKSKPNFTVEITKGGKTMALECTFSTDMGDVDQGEEGYNDVFQISELSIYEGEEIKDSHYSVAGDIMDGYLYDLLMNMLEERGISNEFADHLVDYCTAYEHNLYINLLNQLKGFVSN